MKRIAIVGASMRCYGMFVDRVKKVIPDDVKFVGIYDINMGRSKVLKEYIGEECTIYDDFEKMLDAEKPDGVLVTTRDDTHHDYVIRALNKGYDAYSEKPLTNTFERCLAIRDAEKKSGKMVTTTFNCRYMPYLEHIKELVMSGRIGKVYSMNYEYALKRTHGGDYFKRWHRLMEYSQGMLLHKSTHHLDVANWIIDSEPRYVTALANRVHYGDAGEFRAERCTKCPHSDKCQSYVYDEANEKLLKQFYYDNEGEDGYIRDRCAFTPDADINDNYSVSVMYQNGALLTYTLQMASMHEGYNITITGEKGVIIASKWSPAENDNGKDIIKLITYGGKTEILEYERPTGCHDGADDRLIKMLFNGYESDPLNQCAGSFEGVVSAMVGIAGNMSIKEGKTIDLKPFIDKLR